MALAAGLIDDAIAVAGAGPVSLDGHRVRSRIDRMPLPVGADEAGFAAHLQVAAERYHDLEVALDPHARTYWCFFNPQGRPSFTPGLLRDLKHMQRSIKRLFAEHERAAPFDYFVVASRLKGIFNLGGDLGLFADSIRRRDREGLRLYAKECIDVLHDNAVSYGLPVVTIGLVQGDALGGGFEAALSCDVIIAERSAKFGLPEILFNLFPGMGAYSFLSRRLDAVRAERMILSGRLYEAAELQAMGLVDEVVDDGVGEAAVREYVARHGRRHNAQRAVYDVKRRVRPLPYQELEDVIDIWVDAALRLNAGDLRKMERLTTAQDRRRTALSPLAALQAG